MEISHSPYRYEEIKKLKVWEQPKHFYGRNILYCIFFNKYLKKDCYKARNKTKKQVKLFKVIVKSLFYSYSS